MTVSCVVCPTYSLDACRKSGTKYPQGLQVPAHFALGDPKRLILQGHFGRPIASWNFIAETMPCWATEHPRSRIWSPHRQKRSASFSAESKRTFSPGPQSKIARRHARRFFYSLIAVGTSTLSSFSEIHMKKLLLCVALVLLTSSATVYADTIDFSTFVSSTSIATAKAAV